MRVLLFACLVLVSLTMKISVINDIHLDVDYKALPTNKLCWTDDNSHNIEIFTDWLKYGTWGCDSPFELVETVYEEVEKQDHLDLIIMSGDYAAHGLSAYPNQKDHYSKLKEVHTKLFEYTKKKFPNTPIVPAIGNNDPKWHNQFPLEESTDYFEFLFDLWFASHPVQYPNLTDIRTTFLKGGFYWYFYGDYVFIALNSLYFYSGTEN